LICKGNLSEKLHTKSTKEEEITKKREGVIVQGLCMGLHDRITDKNP